VARSIYLAFLNGFVPRWARALSDGVNEAFGADVRHLNLAVDLDTIYSPDRGQYHATLLLAALLRHLPDSGSKILGVTGVDLFIPVLTFVFGQAQLDGPSAVISTYRLHQQFYGLPEDEGALVDRAIKEAVHELGHAFGLVHCPDYACVMRASSAVEEVDLKGAEFCAACLSTLGR